MRNFYAASTYSFSLLIALLPLRAWSGNVDWAPVGDAGAPGTSALNGTVNALHANGTDLYVGGNFTDAGGVATADSIAVWNGVTWSGLAPLNGAVHAIAFANGRLHVGGTFTNAGGNANADFLAAWNGTAWEPVCNGAVGPAFSGNVLALRAIGSVLFIGGTFQNAAGIPSADYLLACNVITGATSSTVAVDGNMSGPVYALTSDSNGTLYVGGAGININGVPAIDYVGAYDGTWRAMGSGPGPGGSAVTTFVRALASDGVNVYIGTDALDIAGIPGANHVARWNGVWNAMGSNYFSTSTSITALAVDGARVFAGGTFQNANGDPLADSIVRWDGVAWNSMGSNDAGEGPLNASANALATLGSRLFVGGSFTSAGGNTLARFIAQSTNLPVVLFGNGFE